jgi:hypothetical protein
LVGGVPLELEDPVEEEVLSFLPSFIDLLMG